MLTVSCWTARWAYKRLFAFLTGQHRLRFPKQGAQLPVIAEELVEPMFPPPNAIASPGPSGVEKTKKTAAALQGSFERAKEAAHFVEAQTALRPRIALLLGAAFDSIANQLTDVTTVKYETIPHFPRADRSSHAGRLVIGKLADVSLAVLCGRVHYYEGLGLDAVVFPIRMLARMGICSLVITSAAWWRKSGVYARQPRCSLRPHQSAREQSDDGPAGRTTRLSIRGYERSV